MAGEGAERVLADLKQNDGVGVAGVLSWSCPRSGQCHSKMMCIILLWSIKIVYCFEDIGGGTSITDRFNASDD